MQDHENKAETGLMHSNSDSETQDLVETFHSHEGYSHDEEVKTSNEEWMKKIKNDTRLSELSLPGTHDSMSFYGGDIVRCQTLSLEDQLISGVRVLDIRCRHIEDVFAIHHGSVFQKAFFGDVLNIVADYLEKNQSECVLMRVKEEYKPENVTRTFEETFRYHYWDKYKENFLLDTNYNPIMCQMRGKIVILQDLEACNRYGINYNNFCIQDDYHLDTNWDLYGKWEKVKDHFYKTDQGDNEKIYMNYLSGSGGSFPYFVASGHSSPGTSAPRLLTGRTTPGWKDSWPDFPRIGCFLGICSIAFEGTNILSSDRIPKEFSHRVGLVMSDFPGPGLINNVVEVNNRYFN